MAEMKYRPVMWAEQKPDVYDGPKCDQHKPRWNIFADGDKDDDTTSGPIIMEAAHFPAGTKVVVSQPVCPDCDEVAETCSCGFDWKQWADDEYS